MSDPHSPTDWLDYDRWPGPDRERTAFEILRDVLSDYQAAFLVASRAFGKSAGVQSYHQRVREESDEIVRFAAHFSHVHVPPDLLPKPDPFKVAVEAKKNRSTGPRPARAYDHHGRRRF